MSYSLSIVSTILPVLLVPTLRTSATLDAAEPDPVVLLQGVASTRLQIPPSSLTVEFIYRDPVTTNSVLATVDFDGPMRAFTCSGDGATNSAWRTLFEGIRAIAYEEKNRFAEYQQLGPGNHLLLFDPRVLGLTHAYAWDESPDTVLPTTPADVQTELIGRERMGEQSAWHVRVALSSGNQTDHIDYWIDDLHGFRVYRRDWNGVRTFSEYENVDCPWLPSRVISKVYDSMEAHDDTRPLYEKEIRIVEARVDVTFPKDRWTLGALSLKRGTEVFDRDLNEVIGKWNGKQLVSASTSPHGASAWSYIVVVAVLLGPVMLLWITKTRRQTMRSSQ